MWLHPLSLWTKSCDVNVQIKSSSPVISNGAISFLVFYKIKLPLMEVKGFYKLRCHERKNKLLAWKLSFALLPATPFSLPFGFQSKSWLTQVWVWCRNRVYEMRTFPQSQHSNGFSSTRIRLCPFKSVGLLNDCLHCEHLYRRFLCVLSWFSRCIDLTKVISQWLHLKGLSQLCVSVLCLAWSFLALNVLSQWEHLKDLTLVWTLPCNRK